MLPCQRACATALLPTRRKVVDKRAPSGYGRGVSELVQTCPSNAELLLAVSSASIAALQQEMGVECRNQSRLARRFRSVERARAGTCCVLCAPPIQHECEIQEPTMKTAR